MPEEASRFSAGHVALAVSVIMAVAIIFEGFRGAYPWLTVILGAGVFLVVGYVLFIALRPKHRGRP